MKQPHDDELISWNGKTDLDQATYDEMAEEVPEVLEMETKEAESVPTHMEVPKLVPIPKEIGTIQGIGIYKTSEPITEGKEIGDFEQPKHAGGRPPKFNTPEELDTLIDQYLNADLPTKTVVVGPPNNRTTADIPCPTVTGLARYLGFESRQSFYDYEKNPEFSYTIKSARLFIEQHYEELLQTGLGSGAIFALKNFGWKDRSELDVDPDGTIAAAVERVKRLIPE